MVVEIVFKNWFKKQVVRLDCDSMRAIFMAKNLSYHSKMKNIDVQ